MFYMRLIASFGLIFMGGRTYQFNRYGQIPQPWRTCQISSRGILFGSFRSWNTCKSTQIQGFSLILAHYALQQHHSLNMHNMDAKNWSTNTRHSVKVTHLPQPKHDCATGKNCTHYMYGLRCPPVLLRFISITFSETIYKTNRPLYCSPPTQT